MVLGLGCAVLCVCGGPSFHCWVHVRGAKGPLCDLIDAGFQTKPRVASLLAIMRGDCFVLP